MNTGFLEFYYYMTRSNYFFFFQKCAPYLTQRLNSARQAFQSMGVLLASIQRSLDAKRDILFLTTEALVLDLVHSLKNLPPLDITEMLRWK